MDMLVVGMNGKGNVGLAGCTEVEYRTHYSLWALLGSPLMIGCDITNMDEKTKSILMNKDIIAINQDEDYNQAYDASDYGITGKVGETPVFIRLLQNGDYAIGFFNYTDEKTSRYNSHLLFDGIGLPESTGKTLKVKELWTGEEKIIKNGIMEEEIEPHGCRIYRAKVVDQCQNV